MKLLVAEDRSVLRDALCQLLLMEDDVDEILRAGDGAQAIGILQMENIGVVALDVEMPKRSGPDVLEWIRKHKEMKVIIVTTLKRVGYFERAVKAGVDACVLRDRSTSELMTTIHTVFARKKGYLPELVETMMTQDNPLSQQERHILQLIPPGKTNQEIADTLYLSSRTVRNYISSILNKLSANSRVEATRIAEEHGWV